MASFGVERIPHLVGYLVISEDGGVISSGGDLENNETMASVVVNMVKGTDKSIFALSENEPFKRLSINYDDHFYMIALSNRKIHVVKRKYVPLDSGFE